ncbi:ketoacyl-ACP synthase III [Clostridium tetani]|uniref:Ketoacyl-ACP synthase III n=1 Tax=Clostridium tetani TaxID=1513 RepID=A0ABY0ENI3_CLOTA|nr:ketoacyl-ACP synthase III [Clostridium tetani]CDI48913.1 3-oxoacyl-ACP synthase [Clostridium tetani 12124569]KHO39809.1 hypothetical protein OR62_04280 [Clostridium tetani]RXI38474.1 ketoacyl-ACP synthase III [Clostridium tetani]RXI54232.1 ketoacyl-ACP synthase III [Clostridium tetani]RXI68894.1 ketoacyl-ACP synthase III [Clostridium tetani]
MTKLNRNVIIKSVGTYVPKKKVHKDELIQYFEQYGSQNEAKELMDEIRRETISIMDENETVITMSLASSKICLEKAGLTPNDIDVIISASNTPEFLSPTGAMLIRDGLNSNAHQVLDVNCDCIGMLQGLNVATSLLKLNKQYKRALVVGAFGCLRNSRKDNIISYATVGDNSTAMILEVEEEEIERGFLGHRSFTDSQYIEAIQFPACGMSKIFDKNIDEFEKRLRWDNFNSHFIPQSSADVITELLTDYNYKPEDVTQFFLSQFSIEYNELTMDAMSLPHNRFTFIADKYGYTGPCSPLLALHDRIQEKPFSESELCIMCSVAAGCIITALLYKW